MILGGQFFDLQPIIFYSIRNSSFLDFDKLPMLDQNKLFYRATKEEFINFSITKANINDKEILDIKPDAQFEQKMDALVKFDRDDNLELLREIDRVIKKSFNSVPISELKAA